MAKRSSTTALLSWIGVVCLLGCSPPESATGTSVPKPEAPASKPIEVKTGPPRVAASPARDRFTPEMVMEAQRNVRRLAPEAFPEAPKTLRAHLDRIGCLVPQVWASDKPHNLISGEFQRLGQTDWAVLCEIGDKTAVLVFWDGDPKRGETLTEADIAGYLQVVAANDVLGFSHAIFTAEPEYIVRRYELLGNDARGDTLPPTVDHQGIDDAFTEKGSIVHYWFEGKWLELPGSD